MVKKETILILIVGIYATLFLHYFSVFNDKLLRSFDESHTRAILLIKLKIPFFKKRLLKSFFQFFFFYIICMYKSENTYGSLDHTITWTRRADKKL